MGSSAREAARDRTSRAQAWAAGAALLALGCASDPAAAPPHATAPAPAEGALAVELVFGADADLDLYVSDPAHETAYFANTPVRSGGVHEGDARCDADAPRIEVVRWEAPPPGRYRVGVDFPERCDEGVLRAPYRIRVVGPSGSQQLTGEARFGRFDPLVLDFEVGE